MYSPNLLFFIPNLPRTSLDDDSVILFSGNIEFSSYDGFFWLGRFRLQITVLTVKANKVGEQNKSLKFKTSKKSSNRRFCIKNKDASTGGINWQSLRM